MWGSGIWTVMPVTQSIVSFLLFPQPSKLARKPEVKAHSPVGKKRSMQAKTDCDRKSVALGQRVREFPEQLFAVSSGKLFCSACCEELGLKASFHQPSYHVWETPKWKWERATHTEAWEMDITTTLEAYNCCMCSARTATFCKCRTSFSAVALLIWKSARLTFPWL